MRAAFIQLHIAVFLAGITGILGKLILLNEGLLVWYRLLITSIALWSLLFFSKKRKVPSLRQLLRITLIGGIVALHWVAFYGSIRFSNVSVALVSFSLVGFFSSWLEPLLLRQRFVLTESLLGLLSVLGVALIFHFDARYKTGILYGLASAFLASLFTVLNKQVLREVEPLTLTIYEISGGLLVLTIILPFYLSWYNIRFAFPSGADWGWLMVLAMFCTVLAFVLQLNALRKISSFTVNLTYNLEPFYGIILAFLLFHENRYLNNGFYIGAAIILTAVFLQMMLVYRNQQKGRRA